MDATSRQLPATGAELRVAADARSGHGADDQPRAGVCASWWNQIADPGCRGRRRCEHGHCWQLSACADDGGYGSDGVRTERGADNYDLGLIRESLDRTTRAKRREWIGTNIVALDLHIKASDIFAGIIDHIWSLEPLKREQRPSADVVRNLVRHAQTLILQCDDAADMQQLNRAVGDLRETSSRLQTINAALL